MSSLGEIGTLSAFYCNVRISYTPGREIIVLRNVNNANN